MEATWLLSNRPFKNVVRMARCKAMLHAVTETFQKDRLGSVYRATPHMVHHSSFQRPVDRYGGMTVGHNYCHAAVFNNIGFLYITRAC